MNATAPEAANAQAHPSQESIAIESGVQPIGWLLVGVLSAAFLFPVVGLVKTTLFVPEPIEEIGAIPQQEGLLSKDAEAQLKALQDGARKENIHNLIAYSGCLLAVVFGIWTVMSLEGPSWRWSAPILGLVIAVF
ncbi:MAG: hypothetical protein AAF664_25875, partial [Planctomycetota bacterium]